MLLMGLPMMQIASTSRDSPPLASIHCYGAPLTTFPQRYFNDDGTTITILVYLMMLGQCMLPATISYNNGECNDYNQEYIRDKSMQPRIPTVNYILQK